MATKKITELPAANTLSGNSLLVAVTDPNGAATTRKITVSNFFSNVTSNVTVSGSLTITSNVAGNNATFANVTAINLGVNSAVVTNTLVIPYRSPPANSTSLAISNNAIFHDGNFIYVATANNVTKRVAITSF